ncbi:tetratricopeptide repeat protein [Candidatus Mycosynbacter amalyticus]|uniref:Tetratricopeptide repeat protein n=1 Tax=Candidatus Mycosynbacter amalyticus TaxID=2665156 RepID=A0A857MJS3_9BACT|nr:tetratricopeptide repeat protein [Candidatus Mycosynbacter amalyticus]QHN42803.1 tetratricopeptide repeat protein [Candidatus Mycosynbacter amalyticus]
MFGLLLLVIIGIAVVFHRQTIHEVASETKLKFADKLDRLWDIAQESLRDKKYLRAEKALLTILRVDERNATAYNRLGILYAKQQAFPDAIECFEIAQSLEPSASSLHNVGLIYFETEKYDKAALAFEQAIAMEEGVPSRHIAYAKVQEKLGHKKKVIESLQLAVELDGHKNPQSLRILADAYERDGNQEQADLAREEMKVLLAPKAPVGVTKTVKQPRKVVM